MTPTTTDTSMLCIGVVYFFEGEVVGTVVMPRLENGFGWDLIFVPEGHTETFAEMTEEQKNTMSHRGRAAEKLYSFLQTSIL